MDRTDHFFSPSDNNFGEITTHQIHNKEYK